MPTANSPLATPSNTCEAVLVMVAFFAMPLSGVSPRVCLMPQSVASDELVFSGSETTRRSFQRGLARSDHVFGVGSPFSARLLTMITITCALVPAHRFPALLYVE